MIRTLLVIALPMLSAVPVFAQRTEIILLTGGNSSVIKEKGESPTDRRYSLHGGFLFGIGSESVMFETGLIYISRGARLADTNWMGFSSYRMLRMDYLDVPFIIIVAPERLRFFVGPQISIMTKAEMTSGDYMDAFEKNVWGLRFGSGFQANKVHIQVHVVRGLSDINRHPDYIWKNNSFQLSLGLQLFSNYNRVESGAKKKRKDDVVPDHRVLD